MTAFEAAPPIKARALRGMSDSRRIQEASGATLGTIQNEVVNIACLRLRVCGLLSLQRGDIDFENLTLRAQRSFIEGEIHSTNTEASSGELPLDPDLAGLLRAHRTASEFSSISEFSLISLGTKKAGHVTWCLDSASGEAAGRSAP